jgi:hypothetical protein
VAEETFHPETLLETEEAPEVEQDVGLTRDALERILAENRAANADLIAKVVNGRRAEPGVPLQQDDIIPDLNFSLEGLPDPAHDPRAFHVEYMKRMSEKAKEYGTAVARNAERRASTKLTDQQVLNRVEGMIKGANPNLTDEVIGTASGVIAARYRSQGRDPMSELRARPDEVGQEVLDYIDDLAEQLGARAAAPQRTAGLVSPRGNAAPRRRAPAEPPEDKQSFYKELTKLQTTARIY